MKFIAPTMFLKDIIIEKYIKQEALKQYKFINLIASENYASTEILNITGSNLTNKYAEGYPGKRYYGGCENVDQVEILAIERCKRLFDASYVNVQPHSGSNANLAVYFALLKPGDTILGMGLAAGGHLTHGWPTNLSGSWFNSIAYGVDPETELIDYEAVEQLAEKHKPKLIIAGASAYSRIIDFARFRDIAQSVGAYLMVDIAHIAGLVATSLHPSPICVADVVTSTTHKTLRGPRGGLIMSNNPEISNKLDKAIIPGIQGGPLMHVIAAKAVCFYEALQPHFPLYIKQVLSNTYTLAQELEKKGYRIVTGGTDNHLMIIDLRNKNCTGKEAEEALIKAGIIVNRNCIPYDPEKPFITSGIRIGTAAVTTLGLVDDDMCKIATIIDEAITARNHENELIRLHIKVETIMNRLRTYHI